MGKVCDTSHLSPAEPPHRVHPGMTAIERAYRAPFGVLLMAAFDLLYLVEHHNVRVAAGGGGGGIEMTGEWARGLLVRNYFHPIGPAEA